MATEQEGKEVGLQGVLIKLHTNLDKQAFTQQQVRGSFIRRTDSLNTSTSENPTCTTKVTPRHILEDKHTHAKSVNVGRHEK